MNGAQGLPARTRVAIEDGGEFAARSSEAGTLPLVHPAYVGLLVGVCGFLLHVNLKTPLAGEDFALTPWPSGQAPRGLGAQLGAIASAMLAQAVHWNARLGEMLAILFGALPKDFFSYANTAVIGGLILVLFVYAFGRLPDWRRPADAFPLLVLCAALLALHPTLGTTVFWRAGTLNHTWGLFVLLCWAVPFRLLAAGRDVFRGTRSPIVALYCTAGVVAGMTVETAGVVVVAAAGLLALWRRRELPRWFAGGGLALVVGIAALVFAPSTAIRRAHYASGAPDDGVGSVARYVRRLGTVLADYRGDCGVALTLLALLGAWWAFARRREIAEAIRRRTLEGELLVAAIVGVTLLASFGTVLALATIPYHSDQRRGAALHWYMLFGAVAFVAAGIWHRLRRPLRIAVVLLVVAAVAFQMRLIARAYAAYSEEAARRHHEIEAQRRDGGRHAAVDLLLARPSRLLDPREDWSMSASAGGPSFIARYYGLESFSIGGPRPGRAPPAPGAKVLHGIDGAQVRAGTLTISGWAVLEHSDAAAQRRFVILSRPGSDDRIFGTTTVLRPDVARAFGRPEYAPSGFEMRVQVGGLPTGEYDIGVLVLQEGASGMRLGSAKISL